MDVIAILKEAILYTDSRHDPNALDRAHEISRRLLEVIGFLKTTPLFVISNEKEEEQPSLDEMLLNRPRIITICGSTRFLNEIRAERIRLTLEGHVVIGPEVDMKDPVIQSLLVYRFGEFFIDHVKKNLDELHKAKIALADEVRVVNTDGYIGDSTMSEIIFAKSLRKRVSYTCSVHP